MILLESCATEKSTIGGRTVSSDQVHEIVHANQLRIETAVGEGTISVETPSIAQTGSFALALRKPDSLLVQLKGPFGIKVGSALFTRTHFQFYNSLQNRLISGETTRENLSKILHVDVGFDDLLSLFTGGTFLSGDAGIPDASAVEDELYMLQYRSGKERHKYFIDPATLMITKVEFLDEEGKLELEQRFVNFQRIDSAFVPFNIRIVQPKQRRMMSVVYSDLNFNLQNLEFTFTVPNNAQRVHWQ